METQPTPPSPETLPAAPDTPAPAAPSSPRRIGKFVLLQELGSGGMGTVYKAFQVDLQRTVALKALSKAVPEGSALMERFQREARAVARLSHPGIVRVFEVGEADGVHYFTMEMIEGEDLIDRVRRENPPLQERVRWIRDAAVAVHHAHEMGLVHRDLKPGNILIDKNGVVKVADFGLAFDTTADRRLTMSGEWMGTPHYMAPEQARGDWNRVGPASDVYSLAATLYDVVSGVPPVDATDVYGILERVTRGQLTPLRTSAPQAPRDLETICTKAMELDPLQRYASAKELAEDLDRLLRLEAIRARPLSWLEITARRMRREWKSVAAIVAVAVAVPAGVWLGYSLLQGHVESAKQIEVQARQEKDAEDLFRQATNPDWVLSHGGVPEQVRLLERAVTVCPTFTEGNYKLGVVCEETGRIDRAVEHYQRAASLDPHAIRARARLAILWTIRGPLPAANPDWERGEALLAALAREAPKEPWVGVAQAFRDAAASPAEGADQQAIAARVEGLVDAVPEARLLLAGIYGYYYHPLLRGGLPQQRELRDLERASREISAFVGEEPLSVIGRMNRGLIRYELGDLVGAEMDLQFVLDNAPAWADPPYFLGRVLFTARRYAESERLLRRSIDLSPEASRMSFLAMVQLFRRDFAGALSTANATLAAAPGDTGTALLRALDLHCLGRKDEAEAELARLASGDAEYVKDLRAAAGELKRPEVMLVAQAVRAHLVEFQDVLFLAPKEKPLVRTTIGAAMAVPRLRALAERYQEKTSMRREIEGMMYDLPRIEREVPELGEATRAAMRKAGVPGDPELISSLVQFWIKLAHDMEIVKRKTLPTAEDYLWRAGAWYRTGQLDLAQADVEEAMKLDRTSARAHYALATLWALRGNAERCAEALRHARQYGWRHLDFVAEDADFARVRDSADVKAALEER